MQRALPFRNLFAGRARGRAAVAAALCVGLLGALFALSVWGTRLDGAIGLRLLYAARGPAPPPADVVIVGMSRQSADRLGLPASYRDWPRDVHAALVDRLAARGAAVIVFDIFFRQSRGAAEDRALAEAIRRSDRTVLFQNLEQEVMVRDAATGRRALTELVVSPADGIAAAARGLAAFPLPKFPARVDQFWSFKNGAGDSATLPLVALQLRALRAPSFRRAAVERGGADAAAALDDYHASPRAPADLRRLMGRLRTALGPGRGADRDPAGAPAGNGADERAARAMIEAYGGPASSFINFYGPAGTIRQIPFDAVLADRAAADADLAGKTVFVGVAELGRTSQTDGFYTVYSGADGIDLSGVEIIATAFANLTEGRPLQPLGRLSAVAVVFAFGALAVLAAALLSGAYAALGAAAIGIAYFAIARHGFATEGLWLPVATPLLLQLPAAILLGIFAQYVRARRFGQNFVTGLRSFLPERVTAQLAAGQAPEVSTEVVYGAVLFTDVAGFTALSETLSLSELAPSASRYFRLVSEQIAGHGGAVLGYTGDGVIGTWNAASFRDRTQMRRQVCLAALAIRDRMEAFERDPRNPPLRIRIGVHEGEYVQGIVGGGPHFEHNALGDTLNTASRIEALNKTLGTRLLVSDRIAAGLDEFLFRRIGAFRLMGKSEALSVCELVERLDRCGPAQRELCQAFEELSRLYADGQWDGAAESARRILALHPGDGPAAFLGRLAQERCGAAPGATGSTITMDRKS